VDVADLGTNSAAAATRSAGASFEGTMADVQTQVSPPRGRTCANIGERRAVKR